MYVDCECGVLSAGSGPQGASLVKRDVQLYDNSFDRVYKTGVEYSVEAWQKLCAARPELAKKAQPFEKRLRDGTVKQYVRVYDQGDGVNRFEEGNEKKLSQRTAVDDGSLVLDEAHLKDAYEKTASALFGDVEKQNVILASELALLAGSASSAGGGLAPSGAATPSAAAKDNMSDDDSDSEDEAGEDVAPLQRQLGALSGSAPPAAGRGRGGKGGGRAVGSSNTPPLTTRRADQLEDSVRQSTVVANKLLEEFGASSKASQTNEVRLGSIISDLQGHVKKLEKAFLLDTVESVNKTLSALRGVLELARAAKAWDSKKTESSGTALHKAFHALSDCEQEVPMPLFVRFMHHVECDVVRLAKKGQYKQAAGKVCMRLLPGLGFSKLECGSVQSSGMNSVLEAHLKGSAWSEDSAGKFGQEVCDIVSSIAAHPDSAGGWGGGQHSRRRIGSSSLQLFRHSCMASKTPTHTTQRTTRSGSPTCAPSGRGRAASRRRLRRRRCIASTSRRRTGICKRCEHSLSARRCCKRRPRQCERRRRSKARSDWSRSASQS